MIAWLFADPIGLLVQIFFAITIIIMIFDKQKPPLLTSIPTGLGLLMLGFSYTSPAVGILSAIDGVLWLVIAVQRYRQSRPNNA